MLGLFKNPYLWSVNNDVDFTPIQTKWADTWERLRCWKIKIDPLKTETTEQHHKRRAALIRRLSQPGITDIALRDSKQFGHVPHHSLVWGDIDSTGIQMKRYVDSTRIKKVPEIRNIVTQIIFDILRYTLNMSEQIPRAKSLAHSIWQSIRTDQVPGSEEPLPDEVSDALFEHKDVLIQPFATLQIDDTPDRSPAQLWFVDRIMETGKLWCGTYRATRHFTWHCVTNKHAL